MNEVACFIEAVVAHAAATPSSQLLDRLADLFPGSSHMQSVGLDCADDD